MVAHLDVQVAIGIRARVHRLVAGGDADGVVGDLQGEKLPEAALRLAADRAVGGVVVLRAGAVRVRIVRVAEQDAPQYAHLLLVAVAEVSADGGLPALLRLVLFQVAVDQILGLVGDVD